MRGGVGELQLRDIQPCEICCGEGGHCYARGFFIVYCGAEFVAVFAQMRVAFFQPLVAFAAPCGLGGGYAEGVEMGDDFSRRRLQEFLSQFFIGDDRDGEIQTGDIKRFARALQRYRPLRDFFVQRRDGDMLTVFVQNQIGVHFVGANKHIAFFAKLGERKQFFAFKYFPVGVVRIA